MHLVNIDIVSLQSKAQIANFMGQREAHLGPVSSRWAHIGSMNLAIKKVHPHVFTTIAFLVEHHLYYFMHCWDMI